MSTLTTTNPAEILKEATRYVVAFRGLKDKSGAAIPRVVLLGRLSLYGDGASRLHDEVVKALADPEIQQRYAALGLKPNGTSPDAMLANVREQLTRYGKAIKDNRITAD